MKKHLVPCIILACLLIIHITGCTSTGSGGLDDNNNESDLPGHITKETGSMDDYAGWWQLDETGKAAMFTCIEIPEDDTGVIRCYDQNSCIVDTGYTDYSEQRALNGNSLIVFTFSRIGEFGASGAVSTNGERWLDIKFSDKMVTFKYRSELPFKTIDFLTAALGDKLNGKMLIETGDDIIGGVTCKTFSLETDHPESFVAEEHFAVSPNGNIYTIDVLQGTEWIPYTKK